MRYGSLFSGIGGMDLGLDRAGMQCAWQVEIDPFCRKVLAKHWKDVPKYEDVRTVGKHNLESVDLIAGGFPCQDISAANPSGAGLDGEKSGLWREFFRTICELRPRYALIENSPNILVRGLDRVLCDLAGIGYDAEWQTISACVFGTSHPRKRMFIVAYTSSIGGQRWRVFQNGNQSFREAAEAVRRDNTATLERLVQAESRPTGNTRIHRGAHAASFRVDRLKGIGNAVVPDVAEYIGRQIMKANQ